MQKLQLLTELSSFDTYEKSPIDEEITKLSSHSPPAVLGDASSLKFRMEDHASLAALCAWAIVLQFAFGVSFSGN
ncbi:MAG: hypothetical protein J5654_05230 [Victivallales bacterium]|nr:hypothetical protein [Victivallales bacterium]